MAGVLRKMVHGIKRPCNGREEVVFAMARTQSLANVPCPCPSICYVIKLHSYDSIALIRVSVLNAFSVSV